MLQAMSRVYPSGQEERPVPSHWGNPLLDAEGSEGCDGLCQVGNQPRR